MYLFTPSLQTSFLCRSPECDKQSSLCSKVCSHWLSILQTVSIVSIYQSQSPGSFHPPCPMVSICSLHFCLYFCFANRTVYTIFLPSWLSGKELTCQRGCHSFCPWVGKIPGGGNKNPLQYPCLGNPMDRGAWQATVHGVVNSQT